MYIPRNLVNSFNRGHLRFAWLNSYAIASILVKYENISYLCREPKQKQTYLEINFLYNYLEI